MSDACISAGTRWLIALLVLASVGLALGACATAESPAPGPKTYTRTVDLSHVIREDVPYRPLEPSTRIGHDSQGRVAELQIGTRTGSLLTVAASADAEIQTVDQLSPRDLVLPAVVIDMRDRAQDRPDYRLSVEDVLSWEQTYGSIPSGSLVLLVTGWDMRWGDAAAYLNLDSTGQPQVPGFDPATVKLLLDQRAAFGLGVDAPGQIFQPTEGNCLLLENLTSLEQLPPTGAIVMIGALKIQAAQSTPARVLAMVP